MEITGASQASPQKPQLAHPEHGPGGAGGLSCARRGLRPLWSLCSCFVPLVVAMFHFPTLFVSLAGLSAERCSLAQSAGVIFSGAHTQDYSFEKGGNTGA